MTKFKELLPKIAYIVGAFAVVVGALLFVIATDLGLGLGAAWLFVTMALALGACVCQVLSDSYRDRRKTAIVLKTVAIALCVLFIAFLFIYMATAFSGANSTNEDALFYVKKYTKKLKPFCVTIVVITVVFAVLSVAGLIYDLVNFVKNKDE